MSRIRFVFEKRGFASFVRHVELPQLFGRVARRAGLRVEKTQGMSPHPHIVMGAALPVGVVSLYVLMEIWFDGSFAPEEIVERMNPCMPEGFRFLRAARVQPDAMSLNRSFDAGAYWLNLRDESRLSDAVAILKEDVPQENLLELRRVDDGLEAVMYDPSKVGPGALVKALTAREVISGWPDICVARLSLGRWHAEKREVVPIL